MGFAALISLSVIGTIAIACLPRKVYDQPLKQFAKAAG
jgi:hypothetical protein